MVNTSIEKVNDLIKDGQKDVTPVKDLLPMLTTDEYGVLSRLYLHPEVDLIYLEVLGQLFEVGAMMKNYEEQKNKEFEELNQV